MCNYSVYWDANNPTTPYPGPGVTPAICGYNQDNGYYCPMWPGDEPFKSLITPFYSVLSGSQYKCNPQSLGFIDGGCL
jgi:hypothetical protein